MDSETKEIRLEDTVPFRYRPGQTFEGERLQQLMDSIERVGLANAIIVRPIENGKYETICGHNRIKAAKALGHEVIMADIKHGLSDDNALELFYDSNLKQQAFPNWNYSQKFETVKYAEKLLKETSRQGKRTDLEKSAAVNAEGETCVQSRQKLNEKPRQPAARDKMAKWLGISTATFSKYRRIAKLPDQLLQSVSQLLDEGRITFQAAYIISNLRDCDMKWLIEGINKRPDWIINMEKLKKLPTKSMEKPGVVFRISQKRVWAVLDPPPASPVKVIRRTKKELT